jgi:cell division septation protein DedD
MASNTSSDTTPQAKQVVFLFMAATVVAVVVFLCGVLVGRGVPARTRGVSATADGRLAVDDLPPATLSIPSSEPSAAAAESAELTYPDTLSQVSSVSPKLLAPTAEGEAEPAALDPTGNPLAEEPPAAGEPPATASPAAAAATVEATRADETASAPPPEPRVVQYYVQVLALENFESVERAVAQLTTAGLPAFFVPPDADAPLSIFKVQVGPYDGLAAAERVKERLETEYQYDPYIVQ